MPTIPSNRADLQSFGYHLLTSTARCSGCKAPIEWWVTANGKKMPFDVRVVDDAEELLPHWSSCPKAQDFRRKK